MLSIIWKFTNHMIKVMDQRLIDRYFKLVEYQLCIQYRIKYCSVSLITKLYFEQNINIQESDRWYRGADSDDGTSKTLISR